MAPTWLSHRCPGATVPPRRQAPCTPELLARAPTAATSPGLLSILLPYPTRIAIDPVATLSCNPATVPQESVLYYNIEAGLALAVTLFINVCVISVFAAGFFGRQTEEGEGAARLARSSGAPAAPSALSFRLYLPVCSSPVCSQPP